MLTDLRHVLRGLRRAPAFAFAAVLMLAIGIGANVAVFALIDAVLFRPLSHHEPERIVRVGSALRGAEPSTRFSFNWADYQQIARGSRALAEVTASTLTPFVLRAPRLADARSGQTGGDSSQILGEIVSGSYFPMLHTTGARGRLLSSIDDEAGASPAAVISRRTEERFFAGREALGATIFLNNRPFTVVGVAPSTFGGTFIGAPIDAWIPIEPSELFFAREWRTAQGQAMFTLLARLAPGVTRTRAQADLDAIAAEIARRDPSKVDTLLQVADGGLLRGAQRRSAATFALVLSVLVGLVPIIVCANVGNLLLARGIGVRRQMAIRLAMGAGRGRLVRLAMTESLVLAGLAGAGALGLASLAVPVLSTFNPLPTLSLDLHLRVDGPVMAAAGASHGCAAHWPWRRSRCRCCCSPRRVSSPEALRTRDSSISASTRIAARSSTSTSRREQSPRRQTPIAFSTSWRDGCARGRRSPPWRSRIARPLIPPRRSWT